MCEGARSKVSAQDAKELVHFHKTKRMPAANRSSKKRNRENEPDEHGDSSALGSVRIGSF